ncbi:MAG: aminoacyl-tRNA hydrolase [Phycisphaerae bacterium]|nr:aminoacyl-tRNA hydrolase [Phycisphaerae bacterium]
MKLIVGLGNPGSQYERTRHNAGFIAIDRLADRHARGIVPRARFYALTLEATLAGKSGDEKCLLMKPTTYMNRSGLAVGEAVRFFKVDPTADLFVIVDDIYLPCGQVRMREGGSAAGHNGLADIERALGTDRYPRCRIGVDPPGVIDQADYVLGRFTEEQWALANPAITKAADAAEEFVRAGIASAANKFNAKDPPRPKIPKPPDPNSPRTQSPGTPDPAPKTQDPQGSQP